MPLLKRLLLFSALFIVLSGLVGPWVISTKLLYGFYFFIYPNMGKLLMFSFIVFVLLTKDKLNSIGVIPAKAGIQEHLDSRSRMPGMTVSTILCFLSFVLLIPFYVFGNMLLKEPSFFTNLPLSLFVHFLLISSVLTLFVSVFGFRYSIFFAKQFKRELVVCCLLSVIYYFAIFYVWHFWPLLSDAVLQSVKFLFSLSYKDVMFIPPRALYVHNFTVSIEEACSGLDSMFLFTTLYILIGIVERKTFNIAKLLLLLPVALVGLFLVNVLRVYTLILVGVLIDPKLTVQLFHTYLGMVLFMVYFALFWKIFYGWMRK
ncbi:MAG: archaeosortase/exosortase family protein [Patescibacteria group bacterium]|jgi:exosortase/archaeosortase family protein